MKLTWKTWIPITMAILGIFYALDARVNAQAQGPNPTGPVVILPMHSDTSPALRTMESLPQLNREILEIPLHPKSPEINPNANSIDPVVQRALPEGAGMPGTDQNFEGVNNINGVLPPDTNGDVGPNHYIQMVNLSFAIWDKQGNLLYGPVNGNTLWQGFGGPCETNNDGDPVALYDETADRWVLTQFAINNGIECVAISTSPDPLGSYHRYALNVGGIPDYPKLSVWGDAYYATYRNFGSGFDMQAAAHNRAKMLVGDPTAETVIFSISSALPTENVDGFIPVDLDGFAPPAGANGLFLGKISDEAGSSQDALVMFEMDVDWTTPANSTFSAPLYMATAAFNDLLCGDLYGACAPQPDTGQTLHMLSFALMHRAAYRNFGSYQAIVANHTVNVGSNQAGVRWYELRNSGSGWDIYQQGTFAPDANHRWMGGIAMDSSGNIALGYSVSSSSVYPSIRYAGRLASDPLGVMGQGEAEIIAGSGSQTHSAARWGDYAMMAVDPFDDCTFWFTTEYIQTTGSAPWRTRVASFKFPTCGGPSGTLTGQVYDSGTMTGIDGAQVVAAGALITQTGGTTADANGVYTITLPVGTYTVTASAFGYVDGTVTGVGVLSGTVTTQDFGLDSATSVVVEGVITDDTMNWPLYAQINIGGGYNGGPIWTDPVSGYYSVTLPVGVYPFEVSAFVEGYTPQTTVVTVTTTLAPEGGAATYCSTPNIPFPDDPDITDSLVVPDSGVITDLNLQITAAHTWVGDTTFTLTHNDTATSVVAIDRPGWTNTGFGCSSNDINVNLDDEGVDGPVESQCAVTPPALFGNPTPNNPLSAFDTQNVAGTWTITASDAAGGDTGTLNSWCISAVVEPPAPVQTANFSLVADPVACTAPGYVFGASQAYSQDFEADNGGFTASGTASWAWGTPTSGPGAAHSGVNVWGTNLAGNYNDFEDTIITSPAIDLSMYAGNAIIINWWQWLQTEGGFDYASVDVSNDGGATWDTVYGPIDGDVDLAWADYSILLDPSYAVSNFHVRFHFTSDVSITYPGWYIDDVSIDAGACNPPASGGLVVGNVYDVNTLAPINGAWVTNTTGELAYAMPTLLDPAVDDAFYTIYSLSGNQDHTATYDLYGDDVQTVSVVDASTVAQDFFLSSGFIETEPDAFNVTLELGTNATYPLTLTEIGGADVEFVIAEVPGISPVAGPGSVLLPLVTPSYPAGIQRTAKDTDGLSQFGTSQASPATSAGTPADPNTPDGGYTLTHSLTQNIVQFNSVACNAGGLHTDNSYLRRFTLDDFGINTGFDVVSVDIGIETATSATGTQPVEVRLYTWDPSTSFTYANFTLIGQTATDLADLSLAVANIPVEGTVPAGGTLVVEFFTPNGQTAGNGLFVGSNADGQTDFTFLVAADCGVTEPTDTGAIGFPGMHWVLNVNGTAGGDVPWVIESPITGTVPANGDATVNVTFDASQVPVPGLYTAFLNVGVDTPQESVMVPLTLTVTCSTCGTLEGEITDQATSLPLVSTVHITNTGGLEVTLEDITAYNLTLLPGDYFVTASATGYISETAQVTVSTGGTTTQDFSLWANTSLLSFSPAEVEEFMEIGDVVTNTITVTNSGAASMDFEVTISGYSGPFTIIPLTTTPLSPDAANSFKSGKSGKATQLTDLAQGDVQFPAIPFRQPDAGGTFVLDQVPNGINGLFADSGCDLCGTGAQSIAENFVIADTTTIGALNIWSGYFPSDVPITDDLTVIFHQDAAGAPGPVISTETSVANVRTQTGVILFGVHEYFHELTLSNAVTLSPGTYWIEIFNASGFGTDDYFWETGNVDVLNGIPGSAWTTATPGSTWNLDPSTDLAIQLIEGSGGTGGWASAVPAAGTVPPFSSTTFKLVFDATSLFQIGNYYAELSFDGTFVNAPDTMPLTMHLSCSTCGFLIGDIYDAFTNLPVDADVFVTSSNGTAITLTGVASYSLALQPGTYDFLVTADGYFDGTDSIEVTQGATVETDFALIPMIAILDFSPDSVEEFMNIGDIVTNTVTVTNSGTIPLDYEVNIGGYSGPFVLVSKTEVHIPRFTGEVDKIDRPLSAGPAPEVTKAHIQGPIFETPMGEQAYGLDVFPGLNLVQFPDVDVPGAMNPIGSVPQFHPAGDFLNGDFSTLYALDYDTNEFVAIDTATGARTVIGTTAPNGNWSGMSGATDGTLYAASSNCGVSSTLYTVDPSDGTLTTVGEIGSGTCIIDIAINADGEMFGVDIVSDNLYAIDPSTGAGTIVGSLGVDANFAQGMDFEENSGILYWSAYTAQGELRIIDTATGASASVGAFAGGAEIDAFAFTTGGSGGVGGWAYAVPNFGTIPPFSVTTFDLVFDATSLFQTGDYFAELSFDGNFVNDPGTMPLTMHVSCPTCGFLAGDIYDAFTTSPVDADVFVSSSNGTAITLTGVASYSLALQPGTYDFLVTANDYFSATASVELAAGQTVVTDFPLTPMVAVLESTPAGFETTLVLGQVFTDTLVLNNSGTISFDYSLSDVQTGSPLDTRTPMAGSILLVDDDDNGPDVQAYYTTVLDAMGLSYDIWDTGGSDNEPDEATLAGYDTVIWFTGVSFGGTAGPGSAGETALSTWLDSGTCFFISSQDYVFDRGVTTFMTNYLGLASATSDVGQTTVTGQGSLFTGLGPYGLSYPFSNWSDEFTPDGTAEVAFSGDFGNAAVNKITSSYATAFLGYPLEAIASVTDQVDVMSAFLDSCATEAPWLIELPATGSVAAGDSATVEIVFDTSVITQTGTYTAEIRIDGTFDNTASPAVVVMHVVEEGIGGVDLGDSTGVGEPDTVVTHTMWITNTGDYADVFTLAVAGNTWVTDISATTIALDPGEVAYVMCFVSIPADAADGDEDTVSVTVTGSFDADVTDTATATTTADVPEPATYEIYLPILKKQ